MYQTKHIVLSRSITVVISDKKNHYVIKHDLIFVLIYIILCSFGYDS